MFLGGVPWDITDADLMAAFGRFGNLRIEWPGVHDKSSTQRPKGKVAENLFYTVSKVRKPVLHGQ